MRKIFLIFFIFISSLMADDSILQSIIKNEIVPNIEKAIKQQSLSMSSIPFGKILFNNVLYLKNFNKRQIKIYINPNKTIAIPANLYNSNIIIYHYKEH